MWASANYRPCPVPVRLFNNRGIFFWSILLTCWDEWRAHVRSEKVCVEGHIGYASPRLKSTLVMWIWGVFSLCILFTLIYVYLMPVVVSRVTLCRLLLITRIIRYDFFLQHLRGYRYLVTLYTFFLAVILTYFYPSSMMLRGFRRSALKYLEVLLRSRFLKHTGSDEMICSQLRHLALWHHWVRLRAKQWWGYEP